MRYLILLVFLSTISPLQAKGYKWKIEHHSLVQNYEQPELQFAAEWMRSVCPKCQTFTIYTHRQVPNRWLVTNRETPEAYGIWFKGKGDNFQLVDCYLLNEFGNGRSDEENTAYGEAHGISSDYADIGFNIEQWPDWKDKLFSYPLKHTYKTITEKHFDGWVWLAVAISVFPNQGSMLDTLDDFSKEKDIKNIQITDKVIYYQQKHYTNITKTVQVD